MGLVHTKRKKSLVALVAAMMGGLLALPVFLASPAAAQARSTAPACAAAPESNMTDEANHGGEGSEQEEAIDCLLFWGITLGRNGSYFPGERNSREQMASFILRKLQLVTGFTAPAGGNKFAGEPISAVHRAAVEAIAATNPPITVGFSDGTFRALRPIARDEMASFIVRQLRVAGATVPAPSGTQFPDVDPNSAHADNIRILRAMGIVQGDANGNYRPKDIVTRGIMAIFLTRDLAELVAQGRIPPKQGGNVTVTPTDTAIMPVSTSAADNTGARTYTVTGLDGPVAICLFPPAFITSGGVFRDNDGTANVADPNPHGATATNNAIIELVNNSTASATAPNTNRCQFGVAPTNGQVTFRIDSLAADQAVPVVWRDTDADTLLDLDAQNKPIEPFGLGGQTIWAPPEAKGGAIGGPTNTAFPMGMAVGATAKTFDAFVGADVFDADTCDAAGATTPPATCLYNYDSNDIFQIAGAPTDMATFETRISTGDTVSGTYATEPGLVSTFNLNDAAPPAPAGVTATASTTTNRITVSIPDVDGGTAFVDSYNLYRRSQTTGTPCPTTLATYSLLTNIIDNDAGPFTYVDNAVAFNTSYCYIATSLDEGDESAPGNVANDPNTGTNPVTPPAAGDVTQWQSTDIRMTVNPAPGLANQLENGDCFEVVANEALAAPNAGDTIQIRDANSPNATVWNLVHNTNATFTLGNTTAGGTVVGAGRVLTVCLTANPAGTPQEIAAGTTAGMQLPATVTDQSGVTDAAGNNWNIAGSPDNVVDNEA